jgi:hypothetical protein
MTDANDERRQAEQIIKLGITITGHRASFPGLNRDEYLRGWERALRWVMHQEDPPKEFLTKEFTKSTRTTSTSGKSKKSSTTTTTSKSKSGKRDGTGTTSTTEPPIR